MFKETPSSLMHLKICCLGCDTPHYLLLLLKNAETQLAKLTKEIINVSRCFSKVRPACSSSSSAENCCEFSTARPHFCQATVAMMPCCLLTHFLFGKPHLVLLFFCTNGFLPILQSSNSLSIFQDVARNRIICL